MQAYASERKGIWAKLLSNEPAQEFPKVWYHVSCLFVISMHFVATMVNMLGFNCQLVQRILYSFILKLLWLYRKIIFKHIT